MSATAERASLAEVTHHDAKVNGTKLHYVAAGTQGSPILLVRGFPETWWTSASSSLCLPPATGSMG